MSVHRFTDYIQESLSAEMLKEPAGEAASMAKKMGLNYVGFGRYSDKSGQVKYISKNDRLYPFKGKQENTKKINPKDEEQANETIAIDDRIKTRYKNKNTKKIIKYDNALKQLYRPELFSSEEIDAIKFYTEKGFTNINRYLYKGFDPNTSPDQANVVVQQIQNIDNAFEEAGAPFDYTVYTGLSSRYDYRKIQPGTDYIFRGYISATLDHDLAINLFTFDDNQKVGVVLEIDIKKGQKSLYLESISDTPGEFEALLPRGTKVTVVSGPMMVDSNITASQSVVDKQFALFKCSIVEE